MGLIRQTKLQSRYCLLDYTVLYINYTLYYNFSVTSLKLLQNRYLKKLSVFLSCQNWRAKWATPVLVTKITDEHPAFIPCTLLCAQESNYPHFTHPYPALLFEYTSEQYKHGVIIVFFLFNSLFFAFVSFSWLSRCFSCNHLYSVGARLILPSSVATYNTALKLP